MVVAKGGKLVGADGFVPLPTTIPGGFLSPSRYLTHRWWHSIWIWSICNTFQNVRQKKNKSNLAANVQPPQRKKYHHLFSFSIHLHQYCFCAALSCMCVCVSVLYSIGSIFSAAIFKYLLRLLLLGLLGGRLFLQRFKTDWSELFPLCFRARLLAGRNPNWRWWWLLLTAGRYWRDRLLLLLLLLLLRLTLVLVVVAVSLRRTCLLLTRWPNTWYNQPYY